MNKRPGAEATFDNKLGLTIAEAGSIIGVRRSAVYKLIRTGRLPARKIGSRTIVLRDDAIAFLRSLPALPARGARPWLSMTGCGSGGSEGPAKTSAVAFPNQQHNAL